MRPLLILARVAWRNIEPEKIAGLGAWVVALIGLLTLVASGLMVWAERAQERRPWEDAKVPWLSWLGCAIGAAMVVAGFGRLAGAHWLPW